MAPWNTSILLYRLFFLSGRTNRNGSTHAMKQLFVMVFVSMGFHVMIVTKWLCSSILGVGFISFKVATR
jgi:hypothetical protein